MAGPRAPIGTLSQHAAAAAGLVRNMVPKVFTRTDPKRARKPEETVESESDSDSESSSDSETSETDEDVRKDTKNWADSLKAAKKTVSTPIKAETSPVSSLKAKTASPTAKPTIKKSESSESSDSESESDSGSEDEENKMDVDSKPDEKGVKGEDSDSEAESESSDEEMADSKPTKKAPSASASEDGSASESESSDEESVPGASGAKVATKADTKQSSVSDEESASESESESEGKDEEQPTAKPKTATQAGSDSESESESEGEAEPPRKTKEKVSAAKSTPVKPSKQSGAVNGTAKSKEIVSESESSGSESEGEDGTQSTALEKQKGKAAIRAPPREIVSQGFTLRKADEDVDAALVAQVFKKAKAEGKQIWYFTTPKSVPIEVIQKHAIPLDKVHAGKAIFAHEGAEYTGHFEEPINHAIKVLIPGKDGSKYETMNQSVDRVLHITRVTRFGDEGESEPAPASTSSSLVQGPRPQPKGLKARYQPFGVTGKPGADAADSDEDVAMAQAPPLLNGSPDAKSDSPKKAAKKRKHGDVEKDAPNHEEPASTPAKKPKKARVDSKPAESSPAKFVKQTPIAPPPVPPSSAKTAAPSEPVQPSPVKKSKSKEKSKKKDSASTEKARESKKPAKVTPVLPPAVPTAKSS